MAITTASSGLEDHGLEPEGRANVAGTFTHHFRTDDPSLIDASTITGTQLTALTIDSVTFDAYVTDDGVPMTAMMKFAGHGTLEGKSQPVKAEIRYDFSRFGEPLDIQAPPLASPS